MRGMNSITQFHEFSKKANGGDTGTSGHQYAEKAEITGFTQFHLLHSMDKNAEVP